jgi:type III secretion protein T
MDFVFIGDPFRPLQPYFVAAAFALARMLAMMTVFPVFDRLGVTGIVRNAIALVLSIPLIPMIVDHLGSEQLSLGLIAALLLKEATVGLVVGLVLSVPLYAAEVAGDIVDMQRGSSSGSLSDPLGATQSQISGTLLVLVIIALYFASGCFDLTLRAVYDSYGIWPVRRFLPLFSREAGDLLLSLLDSMIATGLMLVGPIVVCLLLVDLLFALIARAAPSLQPFYLSMTVKNLVFSLVLVLYAAFLVGYMKNGLAVFLDAKPKLEAIGPR